MRRIWFIVAFCAVSAILALAGSSCTRQVGCPANEAAHVKPNRNGELPTSGGSSRLFPKDFNKKAKKKKRQ